MPHYYGFHRQFLRQRLPLLHFQKYWRLLQPASQVHCHQPKRPAQQERYTPAPIVNGLLRHAGIDDGCNHGAKQDPDRQPCGQRSARNADAAHRDVFSDKHPGARYFPADGRALENTHQQQQ